MDLSKRLQAVADLLTKDYSVADIGCDHGYVSIYLHTHDVSRNIIALDVNEGPLQKAKEHIRKYGCHGIETRLSDGLEALEMGEVEAMICAGMGGRLILHILEDQLEKVLPMKECILQPQSELGMVRRQLISWGFEFLREEMVYEDEKYYPMMKVARKITDQKLVYTDCQYEFGPILLEERNLVLYEYLVKRKIQYENLLVQVSEKQKMDSKSNRVEELQYELDLLEEALQYYTQKNRRKN